MEFSKIREKLTLFFAEIKKRIWTLWIQLGLHVKVELMSYSFVEKTNDTLNKQNRTKPQET